MVGNVKGHYEWLWVRSIVLEDLYLTVDICNCTFCVKIIGQNDTLQLLLGRHSIFDIIKFSWSKQILSDYRNGRKNLDREFRHWFCFFWSNYNELKWHCSNGIITALFRLFKFLEFLRYIAQAISNLFSNLRFSCFPFGFEGRMWDLIVSVPDHCLSFYLENM